MERPRLRPLFKLELPCSAARLMAEMRDRVGAPDSGVVGTVLRRHVEITVRPDARHFWSPHLSLDVFGRGDAAMLRGRYAPHPSIWTGIMSLYGMMIFVALAGAVYGSSQWILGWPPWALLSIPAALVAGGLTFMASVVGQRIAQEQMHHLQAFLEECVQRASDPPPEPQF